MNILLLVTEEAKDTALVQVVWPAHSPCMDPRPPPRIQGKRRRAEADIETGMDPLVNLKGMTELTTARQCSECGYTNLGMFFKKVPCGHNETLLVVTKAALQSVKGDWRI